MDNQQKIERLKQYRHVVEEYKEILESHKFLNEKITSVPTAVISDMPKSQSVFKDRIGDNLAWVEALRSIMARRITELIKIEKAIDNVQDAVCRRVLRLRYIDGKQWEEVAVQMNYSWAQTHRIHSDALQQIKL
jgi:DNA-directed RNA polymerase specialized sigma subunit